MNLLLLGQEPNLVQQIMTGGWGEGQCLYLQKLNWAVSQFPLEAVNNLVSLQLYSKAERISTYPSTPTPDTISCVHNPWDPACCLEAGKLYSATIMSTPKSASFIFPSSMLPPANTSGGYSGRTVGGRTRIWGRIPLKVLAPWPGAMDIENKGREGHGQ